VTCCHADRRDDDRYVMMIVTIKHAIFFLHINLLRWRCRYVGIDQCISITLY
jgi:hypothetical protein